MDDLAKASPLPRLTYLSDVPVEASYHGSALIYRLLQYYPPERLQIIEAGNIQSKPERRLKGVSYHFCPPPLGRLELTRFARQYRAAQLLLAGFRNRTFESLLADFKPEALLTVSHGFSWLSAAEIAAERGLPLHLICHDEWVNFHPAKPWVKREMEAVFRKHYQAAASRLCVSPYMIEIYQEQYGAKGTLLYPSRGAETPAFAEPPALPDPPRRGPVFGYAGSLNTTDYRRALCLLAECLQPIGGELLIFGPELPGAQPWYQGHSNIRPQGMLESSEMMRRLRADVDVLFVPMSFAPGDRWNMEISFPSKLTDYTAIGLPLLIRGPSYGSATRWAHGNPGMAELVESPERAALEAAIQRLVSHPEYRATLGRRALEEGERYFAPQRGWETLREGLMGNLK